MARAATGSAFELAGVWYGRVTVGPRSKRRAFKLPTCTTRDEARARCDVLADLARQLRAAGHGERAERLCARAAAAPDGAHVRAVQEAVALLCAGRAQPIQQGDAPLTFQALGERWTSGELARLHPDHVRLKGTSAQDRGRLERYVYPWIGDKPVRDVTLDDCEAIMRALPPERVRTPGARRQVAQVLHRLLALAVFPLRLIPASPLPKGFLPKVGADKAKGWLYPDEDRRLGASPAVPLCWRLLYGFLHREGMRVGEAACTSWRDFDLQCGDGAVVLDENKTDDPRAWALGPGTAAALRAWRTLREAAAGPEAVAPDAPVFVDEDGRRVRDTHLAEQFRAHLGAAGVTRAALFERSERRLWIRLHDTRGTFVTLALAAGRTEAWVSDRTGHRSSTMIHRYKRAARLAAELRLGELAPLVDAIPELAAAAAARTGGGPAGSNGRGNGRDEATAPAGAASDSAVISSGSPGRTRTGKPSRAKDFKFGLPSATEADRADLAGKRAQSPVTAPLVGRSPADSVGSPAEWADAVALLERAHAAASRQDLGAARRDAAAAVRALERLALGAPVNADEVDERAARPRRAGGAR